VAIDKRGYGESDKPPHTSDYTFDILQRDIVELVHRLGRSFTILVAHDWGGIIAWAVAANYPDVVSKLIILNAAHPNLWLIPGKSSSVIQRAKSWYVTAFRIPLLPEIGLSLLTRLAFLKLMQLPLVSMIAYVYF
jgi:epoxide hydrolase 4